MNIDEAIKWARKADAAGKSAITTLANEVERLRIELETAKADTLTIRFRSRVVTLTLDPHLKTPGVYLTWVLHENGNVNIFAISLTTDHAEYARAVARNNESGKNSYVRVWTEFTPTEHLIGGPNVEQEHRASDAPPITACPDDYWFKRYEELKERLEKIETEAGKQVTNV